VKLVRTQIPLQAVLPDQALIIIEDTRSERAVTITQAPDTLCITLNRLPLGNLWATCGDTCGQPNCGLPVVDCQMMTLVECLSRRPLSKETVAVCVVLHGIPSFWGVVL
jgi:hypothetical protein